MKRLVVSLAALLAGIVPATSQTVPGQPASAASNTVQRAAKLTLKHPWRDFSIRLLIPALPHKPGRIEHLKAKRAVYEVAPVPGQRQSPLVLGYYSSMRGYCPLYFVAAEDPHSGKTFIIQEYGQGGYFGEAVYVSRTSGVLGINVHPGGILVWADSDFEMPVSSGQLEQAIRRFETGCDASKLIEKRIKMQDSVWVRDESGKYEKNHIANPNRMYLGRSVPDRFFDSHHMHGPTVIPQIDGFEMTNSVLRLDVRNPESQRVASFWIDLEVRKVIRCVADTWKPAVAPRGRWSDDPLGRISVFIRVVIPASAHEEGRAELVKAWRGLFLNRLEPALVAEDPRNGQPFLSLAVNEGVYVLRPSGVTAVSIHAGGGLVWRESYVEMADSGKREAALKRIEKTWFNGAADEAILKFREAHRIDLAPAAPRDFFFGPDTRASLYSPVIEKAEMTDNILRLGVRNPVTGRAADFWVDLEACKVVECVANAPELDTLRTPSQPTLWPTTLEDFLRPQRKTEPKPAHK